MWVMERVIARPVDLFQHMGGPGWRKTKKAAGGGSLFFAKPTRGARPVSSSIPCPRLKPCRSKPISRRTRR